MKKAQSPVQGAELWVPKDEMLVLRAGAYGPHTEFARVSAKSRFRLGEGLPGAVWATQRALVWRELGTHFVRAELAAAAGIDAALGFPWFNGRELAGVVTLLLTSATHAPAAVELWNHDDGIDVLKHGGGLYANTGEFERVSKLVQFPYAAGLPGLTWSSGIPVVVDDVRASNEFVRADLARAAGLKRGVGLPIYRERRVIHVLTLLGAEAHSFVRAFELFAPGEQGGLVSKTGFVEAMAEPARPPDASTPRVRELLASEARISRFPIIDSTPSSASRDAGSASGIVLSLPIHDSTRLRAVACLEF
jgi:hypothetical protein